ncbi:hypothetical protein [Candidatus Arsenophonus triatominarum]|uniref:hypothetical protein n=1 Tax=Candidatus Arsenophonus triatominarum TaxID=57911 RepID=UPI0007C50C1F|nr:hypothetical protein [Candidatus Arsenophonus triatominarum]
MKRFSVQKGSIVIVDRGFNHRAEIKHIIEQAADVVVRMNLLGLPLLDLEGNKFEQFKHLRNLAKGEYGEWQAIMSSEGVQYTVRVCAYRKTEAQRIESERKYLKKISKNQRKQNPKVQEITYISLNLI